MAITITKQPEGIYPAYNDSIVIFRSSLYYNYKAEITAYPALTFPKVFVIYPDKSGVYTFNLKEIVKVIFNENGFADANIFTDAYGKSIDGLYLEQNIDIEVFNNSTSEIVSKTYNFFKAVKQIGEPIYLNNFQLLSFTPDGVNHCLTYFEGFPFHFDIQRVNDTSEVKVKSLNSGAVSDIMTATATDSFRILIDKGGAHNWTSDNFLALNNGLNRLEVYEDNIFKTNIHVTKRKECSGIYLKWFNRSGGFSFFLFEEFYNERTKGADIGRVLNNEFLNIESKTGNYKSTGKEAGKVLNAKAKYNKFEYDILKDLFISPYVQMYTSKEAYVEGRFIDVFVEGSISYYNKRTNNELFVSIEFPEVITAKL